MKNSLLTGRAALTGVILAGGQAKRLDGQDKGLLLFHDRPLITWGIAALSPQVSTIIISANRSLPEYQSYGLSVVVDSMPGFLGPLAGVLSAMRTANTPWIVIIPCDNPHPPPNLAQRLRLALLQKMTMPIEIIIAIAHDGMRPQPLYALLPTVLANSLADFLAAGGRKVMDWYEQHRIFLVDFSDQAQNFINFNTFNNLNNIKF